MASIPADLSRAIHGLDPRISLLVALDFDGTLSHLVAEPSRARPASGVLEALQRLAQAPLTEVLIISGRALHDLARVSGASDIALLIGSHGQERGGTVALSGAESADLAWLLAAAQEITSRAHGAWIETKPAGFAIHVRACTPEDAERVVAGVRTLASRTPGVHTVEGKMITEVSVRPLDKGAALLSMIERHRDCGVLFAGDDATDETAMAALRENDISIKVGPGPTIARYRVAGPEQMVAVLAEVALVRAG
jgi:trehalose 6-phosphate phosphatase